MGRIIQLADGSLETISSYCDILKVIEAKLGHEIVWELEEYGVAGRFKPLKTSLREHVLRIKAQEGQLMAKQPEPRPQETQTEPIKPQPLEAVTTKGTAEINASVNVTIEAGPKLLDAFTAFIFAARELGERTQATAKEACGAAKSANECTPLMPAVAAQPATLASTTTATTIETKAGPALTLDSIMREAKDKADAGFHAQVINLVAKYGAKSISKITPENLAAFIADVRALGAA
jgi:hypothetical protein